MNNHKTTDYGQRNITSGKNKTKTQAMVQEEINTFNKNSTVRGWTKDKGWHVIKGGSNETTKIKHQH